MRPLLLPALKIPATRSGRVSWDRFDGDPVAKGIKLADGTDSAEPLPEGDIAEPVIARKGNFS
ncbi:MAG: hypothetical protein ACRDRX_05900 [Pseudonocardiaceae bacterium]